MKIFKENSEIWATVRPDINPICFEYPNLPIKKITIRGFPIKTNAEKTIAGQIIVVTAPNAIWDPSKMKNEIIKSLASCSGHTGIAGGQELDLKFENKNKKINQIIDMQKKKTGKLFNFCLYDVEVVANKSDREKKLLSNLEEEIEL